MLRRIKRVKTKHLAQVIGGTSLASYESDVYDRLRSQGFTAKAAMRMAGSRSVAQSFRYGLSASLAARKAAEAADPRTLNASKKKGKRGRSALLPMLLILPVIPP